MAPHLVSTGNAIPGKGIEGLPQACMTASLLPFPRGTLLLAPSRSFDWIFNSFLVEASRLDWFFYHHISLLLISGTWPVLTLTLPQR